MQLKVLQDTYLKATPSAAGNLPSVSKEMLKAGTTLPLLAYKEEDSHIKVTLKKQSFHDLNTWYVFGRHAIVLDNGNVAAPQEVKLSVPYLCQLDNADSPYGTCNVTSMAMALSFLGIQKRGERRFPDELEDYCEQHGLDRHDAAALVNVAEVYGAKDAFTNHATNTMIKEWLVRGFPCVVHGYFTVSGHIITIIGYNRTGYVVNDPYGEWHGDGYDTSSSGKGLTYSYGMMQSTCESDGELWVHFLSK